MCRRLLYIHVVFKDLLVYLAFMCVFQVKTVNFAIIPTLPGYSISLICIFPPKGHQSIEAIGSKMRRKSHSFNKISKMFCFISIHVHLISKLKQVFVQIPCFLFFYEVGYQNVPRIFSKCGPTVKFYNLFGPRVNPPLLYIKYKLNTQYFN